MNFDDQQKADGNDSSTDNGSPGINDSKMSTTQDQTETLGDLPVNHEERVTGGQGQTVRIQFRTTTDFSL